MSLNIPIKVVVSTVNKVKAGLARAGSQIQGFLSKIKPPVGPIQTFGAGLMGAQASLRGLGNVSNDVKKQMKDLVGQWNEGKKLLRNMGYGVEVTELLMGGLTRAIGELGDEILSKGVPGYEALLEVFKKAGFAGSLFLANLEAQAKAMSNVKSSARKLGNFIQKLGKRAGRSGRTMAWFGFRLMMIGRLLGRMFTKPLKKAIAVFQNWERTIQQIGMAMGMMAATGQLTAERQDRMTEAMMNLTKTGPILQGIFGHITAALVNFATPILQILEPAIHKLIDAFEILWEENKGNVLPLFERIANDIIPRLIDVIEELGPVLLENFVIGFTAGLDAIVGLMENPWVRKMLPWIAKLIGKMIGLAPILTIIGGLFFGVSVLLQGFSAVVGLGSIVLGFFIGTGGKPAGIMGVIGVLKKVPGALKFAGSKVAGFAGAIGSGVTKIAGFLAGLGPAGWIILAVIAGIALFALAWKNNWGGIREKTKWAIDGIKKFLGNLRDKLAGVGKALKNFWDKLTGGANKAADSVDQFKGSHDDLVKDLEDAHGQSIGRIMAEDLDMGRQALENLYDAEARGGITTIPQTIPIEVNIIVENMSSDVDIDDMITKVSFKIAEKIEGVLA